MPDDAQSLRFAVLHHTGVAEAHYDLLIETAPDALLRAWRCDAWPVTAESIVMALPDHRRAYLQYEGVISGGRGEVVRVDEGSCSIELDAADELRARLTGRFGGFLLHLKRRPHDRWIALVGA